MEVTCCGAGLPSPQLWMKFTSLTPMPPPDALKAEIDRLCETPAFRNSRVQQKLLRFLAAEALAGRGRELNQYLIATEGLGLGEKFDPTSDSKVRVLGGRLRRMLADQYRTGAGRKSALRVVLPERSFCPAFETRRGGRKTPAAKTGPPTVAVVEFRGLGLHGAWRHYPAVLAENLMAAVAAMHTVEATGPFIRHGRKNPVTAARESGADFILDGSVESAGAGLRLRARLLRGSNGAVVWAQNFDVKTRGRHIPRADFPVVKRLASVLGDDFGMVRRELLQTSLGAAQETISGQEALLLTWHSWMTMAPRDAKAASRAMRNALRRGEASTVVKAHAAMGLLHEWADLPRTDAPLPKAALALAKELEAKDPHHTWSLVVRAYLGICQGAPQEYDRLAKQLETRPLTPSLRMQIACMRIMHKIDEPRGLREWQRGAKENPSAPGTLRISLAVHSASRGRWKEALEHIEATGTPEWLPNTMIRAWAHAGAKDKAAALRELNRLRRLFPKFAETGRSVFLRHCHPDHWRSLQRLLAPLAPDLLPARIVKRSKLGKRRK